MPEKPPPGRSGFFPVNTPPKAKLDDALLAGMIARVGRSRNARINQGFTHASELLLHLRSLKGATKFHRLSKPDVWQDARNALEKLTQCFHEANAFNNAMANISEES